MKHMTGSDFFFRAMYSIFINSKRTKTFTTPTTTLYYKRIRVSYVKNTSFLKKTRASIIIIIIFVMWVYYYYFDVLYCAEIQRLKITGNSLWNVRNNGRTFFDKHYTRSECPIETGRGLFCEIQCSHFYSGYLLGSGKTTQSQALNSYTHRLPKVSITILLELLRVYFFFVLYEIQDYFSCFI